MTDLETSKLLSSSLLIDELMNYGVTYASITLLDKNGNSYFSKSSSDDWLNLYINSKLYQKCHLMTEASKQIQHHKNGFIFLWDNFFPNNEESSYLDQLRKEKNFCHGVAFCSPLANGGKSILTVTGKNADVNFSRQVLRNKHVIYQAIAKSFI